MAIRERLGVLRDPVTAGSLSFGLVLVLVFGVLTLRNDRPAVVKAGLNSEARGAQNPSAGDTPADAGGVAEAPSPTPSGIASDNVPPGGVAEGGTQGSGPVAPTEGETSPQRGKTPMPRNQGPQTGPAPAQRASAGADQSAPNPSGTPAPGGQGAPLPGPSQAPEGPGERDGVRDDTIRIGGLFSLTGPVSSYGKYSSTSVKAFFNMINEQGGINGRKVEYIAYDDAVDSNRAMAAAKRAVEQDKVFALVGDQQIFTYSATGPYLTSKGVPVITAGIGAWSTNPNAVNSVMVGLDTGCQGVLQAKGMLARGFKKPGFLYFSGLEEPLNSRDKTYDYLKKHGVPVAYEEAVSLAQPDFTATVARMRARNVDGFGNLIDTSAMFRLFQSMQRANYIIPSVGPISDYDTTYETLGKQYGELTAKHSIVAEMDNIHADTPEMRLHRETLKKYYPEVYGEGGGYGMWTLYAWDAGRMFVDAMKPLGADVTRTKLLASLRGLRNWTSGLHPPFPEVKTGAPNNFTAKMLIPGNDFKFKALGRDFWWNCDPAEDPPQL